MSFDASRIDWNIENRLGEGDFGIIVPYKDPINDPKGDKWVVKYAEAFDPRKIMMTLQEIVVGSKCYHPNVLPLKSCFIEVDERGKWHIYMKLPRMKMSLENYQNNERRNKPFTQDEIIKYFFGIVSGLEQLHLQKIAHRDVNPANVLLDDKGQVKLTDFGKIVEIDGNTSKIISEHAGTRTYMAPETELEMPLKYKELFKADMWSVGVTMAKLCLGAKFRPVENGEYPLAQKEAFINKNLTELEGVYDSVLLNLIKSLISQDPDSRKTVTKVREILQNEYADILGVENIDDDIPFVKKMSGPKSEKKDEKAPLEKIEEKSRETGTIKFTKSKPETKEEKIEGQKAEKIQAEEGQMVNQASGQKSEKKEEKEAQQTSSLVDNEEPKPSEKVVRPQGEKKESQASESVKEKKIEEHKIRGEKWDDVNEKAELEELKEMKKYLEGSLKQEFTFKAEMNPVRLIIESKDPDKIIDNVLLKLVNQLKEHKGGETFKNFQGISLTLTYEQKGLAVH